MPKNERALIGFRSVEFLGVPYLAVDPTLMFYWVIKCGVRSESGRS